MAKEKTTTSTESEGVITLRKPIMIDGEKVKSFEYDMESIPMTVYMEADARASNELARRGVMKNSMSEFNETLQIYVGMAAVIALNKDITFDDLERVTGTDIKKFRNIGRAFMYASEDESAEDDSDNYSEVSQKPSMQA